MIPWHIIDRYQSGFSGLLSIQWQPVKYFRLHLLKVENVNSIQSVIKWKYHFFLLFQCNLKIKIFIQYSRHYFELTQKSMKWLVNQLIRHEIQTVDGLDSGCEGSSAISDEKDALKVIVNNGTMTWTENHYVRWALVDPLPWNESDDSTIQILWIAF